MDDALAAATRTGGTVKEPKQEIQGMGWFAVVIETEGSEVGLFQSGRAS
jgi:predicted enzyme related to lactoylglutathione lyase